MSNDNAAVSNSPSGNVTDASTPIPAFRFLSHGRPREEAFEAWREIMSRMFLIERVGPKASLPRGGLSAFVLGDAMANRSTFTSQRLTRERNRIDATPDHLVLQLYRSGGFSGEMGGAPVRVARGQVAVCDLRRPLAVHAQMSDTLGVTVPRHCFDTGVVDRLPGRLDQQRERLLAARIATVHRRLLETDPAGLPALSMELLTGLRRLFDPSYASDVLNGPELDADLLTLAERVIAASLAEPDLSPATIVERLHVSRATLYRVFEPLGGVMAHVWATRLDSVRVSLDQPAERRTLTRIAADHGFKTVSHLSRSFRARFGATPREWRATQEETAPTEWAVDFARLNATWRKMAR